jgi:putative ABC transport system permease protein
MRALLGGVALALRAIQRNALRASLTILGILVGVAAVVIVTGLGTGARESVGKQIEAIGTNFIVVFPENSSASGAKRPAGLRLTEDDGRAIAKEAISVQGVAPALRARAQVIVGERNWSTSVVGSTTEFLNVRNWPIATGTMWAPSDETTKARVCVLGKSLKDRLFGASDPIGRTVRIGRSSYRVLGVLTGKGEAPFGGDQDDMLLMPIGSMRSRVVRGPPGSAGVLMVSAKSKETTDRAVAQIDSILRQRHHIEGDRAPDFRLQTQKEFQAMQAAIYGVLTALLVLIAGVSLIVGGIGVMNIMLVSVTERTREIGIRMAIGARASDIQTQFLTEAVVLSTLGGLVGVLLGISVNFAIAAAFGWPASVPTEALVLSVLVSTSVGVGFGYAPARNAARLDPIVALRHE